MKKCVYCLSDISEISYSSFTNQDYHLCMLCMSKLSVVKRNVMIDRIKVFGLYKYNDFSSSLLIQYKECMDEVLCYVFVYLIKKQLNPLLFHKTWLLAPSSDAKLEERGFNHLIKICELLKVKWMDCFEKISENDQKKLNKEERQKINIRLKQGVVLPKNYILFDDICTTGATLIGMKSALNVETCKSIVLFVHPLLINTSKIGKLINICKDF